MGERVDRLAQLPQVCRRLAAEGRTPGGVVLVGRGEEVVTEFAFGRRSIFPQEERATLDTVYDLASLTKPIVTATLAMHAIETGRLDLMEPVGKKLGIARANTAYEITPLQLLLHTSCLPETRPAPAGKPDRAAILDAFTRDGALYPPGSRFAYSDVGFHLLGMIVETALDAPIDRLAERFILGPLGMVDTSYGVPPSRFDRCAPTETIDGSCLCGTVHDGPARRMGGVAGHAGLFGTAADLARYCRMILNRGELDGERVLAPATIDRMIRPTEVPGGFQRALGWDVDSRYSSPRGDLFPVRGVGHTGFTGTSIWIDPPSGIFIVLLTNRVHPDGTGDVTRLRRGVANVVAASLLP